MGTFDKSAIDKDARQYATRVKKGEVAGYVLLPGDPARVDRIGTHLDDVTPVANSREFRTITGSYKGIPVSATSTGARLSERTTPPRPGLPGRRDAQVRAACSPRVDHAAIHAGL